MSESVSKLVLGRPVALALVCSVVMTQVSAPSFSAGEVLSGRAAVIDGDTLDIEGTRVRLEGIDAPESAQTCGRRWFGSWSCGKAAVSALIDLTSGRRVECVPEGRDKYGRVLGICYIDGRDINALMVRSGMAWAFVKYSSRYVAEEKEARSAGAGIWQGDAEPAWVFRERRWASAEGESSGAPTGCVIKGNVTEHGQIYHTPWSPWYGKVKVEAIKGERWFCSEQEAASAGFRPAMQH